MSSQNKTITQKDRDEVLKLVDKSEKITLLTVLPLPYDTLNSFGIVNIAFTSAFFISKMHLRIDSLNLVLPKKTIFN